RIFTTYRHLVDDVKPGDPIWLDDGHIRLRVVEVTRGAVSARVEVGGLLGEHKGINLPGVALSAPSLTETDHESLRFGLERLGADYVALSFVRGAEDVVAAQRFVRESGARTPLIAKIEKPEAIENIEEIMDVADGVMVARGDLGIELGPENVPVAQKSIVQRANSHGKPVIVATQMLESMTREEIPTRAEASDVANAVWDGADAVMLSGETAVGRHPVLVVETMGRIVRSAESALRGKGYFLRRAREGRGRSYSAAITDAACILANDLHAKAIVGITQTGLTAHLLSGRR